MSARDRFLARTEAAGPPPTSILASSLGCLTWDRATARRQARALRYAQSNEREDSYSSGRGEAMLVAEVTSLGDLTRHLSPETTWRARASWRVGHHAGRLFALREARYDSTCTGCPWRRACEYADDPWNTHGDCLASK